MIMDRTCPFQPWEEPKMAHFAGRLCRLFALRIRGMASEVNEIATTLAYLSLVIVAPSGESFYLQSPSHA
ncbi:hypothetical protein DQ393_25245 [Rhizobium tropici]|uniref:Uncharacterized protein n=1 Tax=Rhizobium tropici TaxID=398 RepID=A0A329Y4M3_RHITR|nr:hypothetical protein DQ393_25245 [Rhizobium tropici]